MSKLRSCPRCRALLDVGTKQCPYCATRIGREPPAEAPRDAAGTALPRRAARLLLASGVGLYVLTVAFAPTGEPGPAGWTRAPSSDAKRTFGFSDPGLVRDCGQYWRLATATFLHHNPIHLLFNGLCLLIVVPLAGTVLGLRRAVPLYLLSGFAGAAASHFLGPPALGAGASGAICGLIGALLAFGRRRGGVEGAALSRAMTQWALLILVWSILVPRIDLWAHGIGFGAGFAGGWFAEGGRRGAARTEPVWRGLLYLSAGVALLSLGLLGVQVERSFLRRAVQIYLADSGRALTVMRAVARGDTDPQGLVPLGDPPRGAADLHEAIRHAYAAFRRDPASRAAAEALDAAARLRSQWREEVCCRYGARVRSGPAPPGGCATPQR
ncbi:MAG: rhomboid family intramembrane serine protease [Planctomycetota bacterium]